MNRVPLRYANLFREPISNVVADIVEEVGSLVLNIIEPATEAIAVLGLVRGRYEVVAEGRRVKLWGFGQYMAQVENL